MGPRSSLIHTAIFLKRPTGTPKPWSMTSTRGQYMASQLAVLSLQAGAVAPGYGDGVHS